MAKRGSRGDAPTPGAAACRALRAEAHRARRCRRSATPHPHAAGARSNAATATAPARVTGPSSSRRAFCRRAQITVKGASPTAMAQAPPFTLI